MKRREFFKKAGIGIASLAAAPLISIRGFSQEKSSGKSGSSPQPFAFGNGECYRAVGRGVYDKVSDRTYQVYLNEGFRPWIIAYDHTKEEWAEPVQISSESYGRDNHFYPSMWINSRGYIHVVWGAHGSPFKHLASRNPYDITSWEKKGEIGNGCYAQPITSSGGKEVYLFLTQYGPRRLVYYKSKDGGDTFGPSRLVIGPGYGGKDRGIYIGTIKHQSATDSEPEKFHIPWTFYHNDDSLNIGGRQYPVHYAWFNADNGHVYNAAGEDMGKEVNFPDDWESCLVSQPRQDARFIFYQPATGVTREGEPFVIWTEWEDINEMETSHIYFALYEHERNKWAVQRLHHGLKVADEDVNVTGNGTIKMYYGTGKAIKILTSKDNGQSWNQETIYASPGSELEKLYHMALIDSAHMGSDAARHPDYKVTFKQGGNFKTEPIEGDRAQFAWGENGFLEP